jgi:TrkA domain protein
MSRTASRSRRRTRRRQQTGVATGGGSSRPPLYGADRGMPPRRVCPPSWCKPGLRRRDDWSVQMPEVSETQLPGVGVRHEFTTSQGERLTVLTHRTGRRELAVCDRQDPDRCTTMLHLSPDDTRTLAELLGATHVSESLAAVPQRIEGLAIDWITVPEGARVVGTTIAESALRTRTGASVVAVVHGSTTIPAPDPEYRGPGDGRVPAHRRRSGERSGAVGDRRDSRRRAGRSRGVPCCGPPTGGRAERASLQGERRWLSSPAPERC